MLNYLLESRLPFIVNQSHAAISLINLIIFCVDTFLFNKELVFND